MSGEMITRSANKVKLNTAVLTTRSPPGSALIFDFLLRQRAQTRGPGLPLPGGRQSARQGQIPCWQLCRVNVIDKISVLNTAPTYSQHRDFGQCTNALCSPTLATPTSLVLPAAIFDYFCSHLLAYKVIAMQDEKGKMLGQELDFSMLWHCRTVWKLDGDGCSVTR